MATIFTHLPLKTMRLSQAFGLDFRREDGKWFYKDMKDQAGNPLGLKGHDGWDLVCPSGSEVYAVSDGYVETEKSSGYGVTCRLFINTTADVQLEVVYGHLKEAVKTGPVKAGDLIALSDNTGNSTGNHLHLGIRMRVKEGSGWQVTNYANGFLGYMDPALFFPKTVFSLAVDRQYGLNEYTPGVPSWWEFQKTNAWFYKTQKRLMTTRERNAFRFGFYDIHTVLDPTRFWIWSTRTKPEAVKQGLLAK